MTEASVILLEEHHLAPERCREAKQWCQRKGWKSLLSPALPGVTAAAGRRVILARDSLGLSRWTAGLQDPCMEAGEEGIVAGRFDSGIITLLDGSSIAVASG